jgi:hypothetical protein
MDDATRNILQGLLDMNLAHTRDIAGLKAMNALIALAHNQVRKDEF